MNKKLLKNQHISITESLTKSQMTKLNIKLKKLIVLEMFESVMIKYKPLFIMINFSGK